MDLNILVIVFKVVSLLAALTLVYAVRYVDFRSARMGVVLLVAAGTSALNIAALILRTSRMVEVSLCGTGLLTLLSFVLAITARGARPVKWSLIQRIILVAVATMVFAPSYLYPLGVGPIACQPKSGVLPECVAGVRTGSGSNPNLILSESQSQVLGRKVTLRKFKELENIHANEGSRFKIIERELSYKTHTPLFVAAETPVLSFKGQADILHFAGELSEEVAQACDLEMVSPYRIDFDSADRTPVMLYHGINGFMSADVFWKNQGNNIGVLRMELRLLIADLAKSILYLESETTN